MDFENSLILLHLLWILPMFGLITYYASLKRKKILFKIFGSHSEESQYTTISKGRRYLKIWLMLFAIIFLVIAAARPRWGWRILPFSGRGRDVMIVLDVSKSMNSTDVQPTRLKHAKLFIRNLIKKCPGDRFGLVAFAGSAFLDCPLTVDKTSLFQTLDEIDCNSIPLGGTNVENALNTAISAFKAAEGGYRAIVLLTDGDELHGDSSKSIAKLKKMKIPLFIVGVGDPDGDGLIKLPGVNGKTVLMRDSKGDLVKSRLNERQLKKLKDAAGGIYVRSTATSSELNTIIKKIQGLVPKEYEKGNNKRPIERFHFPLFVAVILLLLILGISERRKDRKNGNGSVVKSSAMVIFLFCATLSLQAQIKEGEKLPLSLPIADAIKPTSGIKKTEGNASKAKKKLSAVDLYNKALKLQNENKIEKAAKLYNQAINRADGSPEVRGKSFQNLGVISHAQARAVMQKDQDKALEILKKSEIMYKEAMRSDTHLKKVILNQQKLLDDRVLAKKIKKKREEMKKKQEQARKKTKEALDEQKKQNKQDKKKKKDEKKKDKKQQKQNKAEQKKQQEQKQQKNKQEQKQNKQSKQEEKKKEQNKSSKNDENKSNKQKSKEKLKEAQKAVDDLEKEAKKRGDKKVEESAKKAKKELKKAEENQKSGEGKKSEEHIKKALDNLGKPKEDKKKESDKKKKKDSEKQGKDKKDKKDKKGQQQNKNRKLDKGKKEEGKKGETKPKKEQEIDPRQAKAILEMMANDEKNLRDAIKENQKINSKTRKVLKDW